MHATFLDRLDHGLDDVQPEELSTNSFVGILTYWFAAIFSDHAAPPSASCQLIVYSVQGEQGHKGDEDHWQWDGWDGQYRHGCIDCKDECREEQN
jgi:hypothetical protein